MSCSAVLAVAGTTVHHVLLWVSSLSASRFSSMLSSIRTCDVWDGTSLEGSTGQHRAAGTTGRGLSKLAIFPTGHLADRVNWADLCSGASDAENDMASSQSFDLSPDAVASGADTTRDGDSPPLRAPRARVSHITLHTLQQVSSHQTTL